MQLSQTKAMPQARVHIAHPALAMIGLMIGAFVGMFSETSLNIALPSLMTALNVSQGTIQWLVTGYMLVIGICMPISSLLSKWFNTKRIILFALGAFILGSVVSAMGASFAVVLIGRLIQGIGTGLILPLMFSVAMQIFPPYKLGTVMGLAAPVIMFAPAIGPTITGLILAKFTWHDIFWLFVPFLVLAFIFTLTSMENVYHQTKTPVDWISIVASSIGFAGIVVGTTMASDSGWLSLTVAVSLLIGIAGLAFYTRRQLTLKKPMLNLRVFANKQFTVGTLLVMLDFGVILASMYLLPMYLQRVIGLPVAMTGLVMLPGGIVNAAVSAIAGRMYDSHGAKWLARGGFVIAILGILILLSSGAQSPLWWIILGHVTLMIGAPLAMSPAQTYGLNSLSGAESADGSALLNTLQQIVGAVSTAVATSMLALGSAQAAGQSGLTIGSHYGFVFVLILAVVGLIVAFQVKKPQVSRDL
ncbi:major facilitator superfamily permease [Lacticaseibacillus zeae DSM 20178 = KCTC 3804]|uniref:Major facilitator superfamily permease n=1 Tax=Lacticaseibacillus zeae DSM 20178 = KCTC 3804 TaxID=1423816 RepID=A0A0R1EZ31_LACZE|nr:DHA2 family efflux MFS transporter permease subunit [Lacticaseibacillus zeae]KRK12164.1 major facilitator superfamily permease [Lacticaseibacillus zeae DSM 20178 = KCTC 3804]